jgi:hypothetical protein
MLINLIPSYNFTDIKYASWIKFELRIDNNCVKGQTGSPDLESCINIRIIYNG